MTTSVVTGGAGFLGSHLCEYLLAEGHRVICLDNLDTGRCRTSSTCATPAFEFRNVDLIDFIDLPEEVDFVFHLASPASPIDYLRLPLHTLKVGSYGTHHALGLAKFKRPAFCWPRPLRSTATPSCTPSPRITGATSTRSDREACTTSRSATPRR